MQWASECSVSLVPLLTLLVFWASWKELKDQVCYIACPEKCAEELCPKCLCVLWSWTRGHRVFHTLYYYCTTEDCLLYYIIMHWV